MQKEEEDEAYRNRATKESLATIKERVGKEKIEEMKSSRLKDDDPRKPLPKILEKQPSSVEIHDDRKNTLTVHVSIVLKIQFFGLCSVSVLLATLFRLKWVTNSSTDMVSPAPIP